MRPPAVALRSLLVAAVFLLAARPGHAQALPPPPDSARAEVDARAAAENEVVAGYGLLAAAAAPAAIAAVALFAADPRDTPARVAGGPLAYGLVLFSAGRTDLPRSHPEYGRIADESEEYRRVYLSTYSSRLKARRFTAVKLGTFIGSIGALVVVVASFRM